MAQPYNETLSLTALMILFTIPPEIDKKHQLLLLIPTLMLKIST